MISETIPGRARIATYGVLAGGFAVATFFLGKGAYENQHIADHVISSGYTEKVAAVSDQMTIDLYSALGTGAVSLFCGSLGYLNYTERREKLNRSTTLHVTGTELPPSSRAR